MIYINCQVLYYKGMGIKEDIKSVLAKEAQTMTDVACKLYKSKNKRAAMSNLSQKLGNETIKFTEVKAIMDLLGYDIEFKKRKQTV